MNTFYETSNLSQSSELMATNMRIYKILAHLSNQKKGSWVNILPRIFKSILKSNTYFVDDKHAKHVYYSMAD